MKPMASNTKRRGNFVRKLHIYLLVGELVFCVLLILVTMLLQVYNLISPPEPVTEKPSMLGQSSLPFQLTSANCFPFLMLPMLALVIIALYLHKYFSRNGIRQSDEISFFDKNTFLWLKKPLRNGCAIVFTCVSFLFCVLGSVQYSLHSLWFGWIIIFALGILYCNCAKQLRHKSLQYQNVKKKKSHGNAGQGAS